MSSQNPDLKNKTLYVNENLVGTPVRRDINNSVGGNYALRFDWGTIDRFRGALGKYYAETSPRFGSTLENYSTTPQSPVAPIDVSYEGLLPDSPLRREEYIITLDNDKWNSSDLTFSPNPEIQDLLTKINFGTFASLKGDPFWNFYIRDGFPSGPVMGSNINFQQLPAVFGEGSAPGEMIADHTFITYGASDDASIREESGLDVRVDARYNFYADTTPPYEDVLAKVPETMITNFYCLEAELQNTGSTLRSMDYFSQITVDSLLNQPSPLNPELRDRWFDINTVNGVRSYTENTSAQYYTLYSKKINAAEEQTLTDLSTKFNQNYKDIAILCSDVNLLSKLAFREDGTDGSTNIPFYNKITIGKNDQSLYPSDSESFFSSLRAKLGTGDFSKFMNILQLYAIEQSKAPSPQSTVSTPQTPAGGTSSPELSVIQGVTATIPSLPELSVIQGVTATIPSLPSPTATNFKKLLVIKNINGDTEEITLSTEPIELKFDWDEFLALAAASATAADREQLERVVNRINDITTSDDDYILLRDFETASGIPAQVSVDICKKVLDFNNNQELVYPHRTFEQVLANESSVSEPILYKIDKKDENGEILQTFYISASDDTWNQNQITYIDSQVKYAKKYTYDIKEIRMVFGNKYSYNDVRLFYAGLVANQGPGRTIGRALGFYDRPDNRHQLHNYIESGIAPYTSITTNINSKHISVKVAGIDTPTAGAKGHYNFQPEPDLTGISQESYDDLYSNGTGWYSPSSLNASSLGDKTSLFNITIELDPDGSGPTDRGLTQATTLTTSMVINFPETSLPADPEETPLTTSMVINFPETPLTLLGSSRSDASDPEETPLTLLGFSRSDERIPSSAEVDGRFALTQLRQELAQRQDKLDEWSSRVEVLERDIWRSGPLAGRVKDPLALAIATSRRDYWKQKRDATANAIANLEAVFAQNGWPLTGWTPVGN